MHKSANFSRKNQKGPKHLKMRPRPLTKTILFLSCSLSNTERRRDIYSRIERKILYQMREKNLSNTCLKMGFKKRKLKFSLVNF
jgi:hypothetical protein